MHITGANFLFHFSARIGISSKRTESADSLRFMHDFMFKTTACARYHSSTASFCHICDIYDEHNYDKSAAALVRRSLVSPSLERSLTINESFSLDVLWFSSGEPQLR